MSKLQSFLDERLEKITFNENFNNDNLEVEIGRLIKSNRLAQKMSQSELALKSGIQQANISKIENGSVNITINQLKRIADALSLSIKFRLE